LSLRFSIEGAICPSNDNVSKLIHQDALTINSLISCGRARTLYLWADGVYPQARREDEKQRILVLIARRRRAARAHWLADGARESAQQPPIRERACQAAEESAAEGQAPREIWMAETRADAEAAFDAFIEKAAECLKQVSRCPADFLRLPC
jgi:hypothetical protein